MRYFVHTWDSELQRFTPQAGVPEGPYTLFGLRKALRALRTLKPLRYDANRDDLSVLVYRQKEAQPC